MHTVGCILLLCCILLPCVVLCCAVFGVVPLGNTINYDALAQQRKHEKASWLYTNHPLLYIHFAWLVCGLCADFVWILCGFRVVVIICCVCLVLVLCWFCVDCLWNSGGSVWISDGLCDDFV